MFRYLFLLFLPIYAFGASTEETAYKPTIISLNNEYPIEINSDNKRKLNIDPQNIEKIVSSKKFSWEYVFGILLFGILFLIARQQPEKIEDIEVILKRRKLKTINKARDSLNELQGEHLPQTKQYDEFYNKITYIVRQYIEEYYALPATTETTEEFLRSILANHVFDNNIESALSDFLKSADKVKFSEHTPTIEECSKAQKTAENFIGK